MDYLCAQPFGEILENALHACSCVLTFNPRRVESSGDVANAFYSLNRFSCGFICSTQCDNATQMDVGCLVDWLE